MGTFQEDSTKGDTMRVVVDPGACRMVTTLWLQRNEGRHVSLERLESECERIQRLFELINIVSFRELFLPIGANPVFIAAEKAKLHPSCPVPIGILKGMEATLGMAVPRNVFISFETD